MMRTGPIPERRAFEGAILAIGMPMMTRRLRKTRRAVSKERGNGRAQRMGRGKGRVRQRRKGSGRERYFSANPRRR